MSPHEKQQKLIMGGSYGQTLWEFRTRQLTPRPRDGRSRLIADDDFDGWVNTTVLFLAVTGQKVMKFWDDVRDSS